MRCARNTAPALTWQRASSPVAVQGRLRAVTRSGDPSRVCPHQKVQKTTKWSLHARQVALRGSRRTRPEHRFSPSRRLYYLRRTHLS